MTARQLSLAVFFMYQLNKKTFLIASLLIAILLSLSPFFVLMEHHQWPDVLDKSILLLTAFFISYLNLHLQHWLQKNSFTKFKYLIYLLLCNLFIFGINVFIRIPFWNLITIRKPPLPFLVAVDFVRSVIIVLVTYIIIAFLIKSAKQVAFTAKINSLENQKLQLQLSNLTAQLQPHFFFNSLNILSELIYIDTQKSESYIQHLSNIFRYVLTNQDAPFVPLTNEIGFIESYMYLLQIRFNNTIAVTYNLNNQKKLRIPSLCCLIVVENIVKHNNIHNMQISISTSSDDKFLLIANSINKKSQLDVKSLGFGLANINTKCELLLKQSIRITETKEIFEVAIPLDKITS